MMIRRPGQRRERKARRQSKWVIAPFIRLTHRRWSRRELLMGGVSLLITAVLCVLVVIYWQEVREFSTYGYIGSFYYQLSGRGDRAGAGAQRVRCFYTGRSA